MNQSDQARVVQALTVLAELYGKQLSSGHLALFCDAVSDLDTGEVVEALHTISRTSKFFPVPGDVREVIEGDIEGRAALAWTSVVDGQAEDEVSKQVVERMGGWSALNAMKYRNSHPDAVPPIEVATKRREFMQLYRALARKAELARPVLGPAIRRMLGDG